MESNLTPSEHDPGFCQPTKNEPREKTKKREIKQQQQKQYKLSSNAKKNTRSPPTTLNGKEWVFKGYNSGTGKQMYQCTTKNCKFRSSNMKSHDCDDVIASRQKKQIATI